MAESLNLSQLTEDLTIQEVILNSLQEAEFDGVEEERREASQEIRRLTRLIEQARRQRHERNELAGPRTPSPLGTMNNDIWDQPASASLPSHSRKRKHTLRDTDEANKSYRTTPTRNVFSSPAGSDPINCIDLTGDDIESHSAVVAGQMREYERRIQEAKDKEMALRLSQEYGPSAPTQPSQPPNAFSRIMSSQKLNSARRPAHGESSASTTVPPPSQSPFAEYARMPGSYDSSWDQPFQVPTNSHPTHPHQSGSAGSFAPHQLGFGVSQVPHQLVPGVSHVSTPAFGSPIPTHGHQLQATQRSVSGPAGGPWSSPVPWSTVGYSHGTMSGGNLGHSSPGLSSMGYPHQPALGGGSGLMDIINRTSEFDYSAGLDGFGNPLPDRVTNFFQDSELSKQELDNLLQNIRPDMELLEENCDATPAGLKHPLYRHQVLALTWMKQMEDGTNKGGILADDMGLGKTISTLALILDRPAECRPKTNLIIGPLSLLRQWEEELAKKTKLSHRLSVFIHHGTKATTDDLLKYDVVLTTYGTIAAELGRFDKIVSDNKDRNLDWSDRALASKCPLLNPKKAVFYRIILDEAQLIKNKDTKTAKACHKLRATYRWCLTGTPMMNGILELWSLIHFLRIKPYADWEKFRVSFGRLFGKKGDPKATAMSRLRALLKAIMLRRKKNSELDGKPILNLPEKSEEVVYADLSPKERANYVQIEERSRNLFRQYVEQDTVGKNYSNILVMLLRMRQACCHPHLDLNAHVDDTAVDDHMLDVVGRLDPATVVRIKAIEAFECPVCQDAVQSPSFFFPCGHDCCRQCLISIVDTALDSNLRQGAESDKAKCPLCRGGFDPKNCFTYEAFQQIHMPEAFEEAKQENADTDEDTEASDSDWDEESNDEVDAKGNLKDFIVDDDVWNDDDNKAVVQEATSNGTVSNGVDDCESKKIRQAAKGKKKKPEMKTSTLKSLRQNAHKSRDAYKKYMRYLRKTWIPAAKVSKCIELIKSIQETGEKTIIFSQWTLHLDLIEVAMHHAKLAKPERYDGSMSGDERSVASRRFRDNANIKVMLVSLRAGNAGLNLVAASRVIIMDPFWNPYIEMQAVDRAYRIGQTKPVKVYRILTEETIEDRIVELQEKKKEMVEAALDETESKKIGRLGVHELRFLFNTSRD